MFVRCKAKGKVLNPSRDCFITVLSNPAIQACDRSTCVQAKQWNIIQTFTPIHTMSPCHASNDDGTFSTTHLGWANVDTGTLNSCDEQLHTKPVAIFTGSRTNFAYMCVRMCTYTFVCAYVCTYVCTYLHMYAFKCVWTNSLDWGDSNLAECSLLRSNTEVGAFNSTNYLYTLLAAVNNVTSQALARRRWQHASRHSWML